MRLFVAVDIDDQVRARIQRFIEGASGFAPDARWASPESLHLTLKFIGEKPEKFVEEIKLALSSICTRPLEIAFRGYGFFPGSKRARILWIGIDSSPRLASLASAIDQALIPLGVPKENHAFNPHITVARTSPSGSSGHRRKENSRNRSFDLLQEKLPAFSVPEFGSMTAREFFLYESRASSSRGPRYIKLARFELR